MVENFAAKLKEYAHLLVELGMNVQKGQTPRIAAPVECAELVRMCVAACYDCGARQVIVDWNDDFVTRQRYLHADEAVFSEIPAYMQAKFDYMVEEQCPMLHIIGDDPELLKGVDGGRILAWQRASGKASKVLHAALDANKLQWTIGAHPTKAWAVKVFPGLTEDAAMDALWEAIFSVCRISGDGKCVEKWKAHVDATARRAKLLNDYNFETLRYSNSLGTRLTIRLPENHVWAGGADTSESGVDFVANIPTEEIFTAPHWDGVDGRVYASMPLSLDGNLVEDFYLDFEGGRIVNVHARCGEETLKNSIATDEGSAYLGEVALVACDSPIRETGILFLNTLFDENAACHLAFGSAYANCVRGGEKLDEEGRKALGLNQSINHVDFMIGTADLSIVGTTHDGREIPVFVDGRFAF